MAINTHLADQKVDKDHLTIELLGNLDEASSAIGLAKSKSKKNLFILLNQIQKDLSNFASKVASCNDIEISTELNWLETKIKDKEKQIDIPNKFVMPGENKLEANLNFARVIVRRAERRAVKLHKEQKLNKNFLSYLNRLSWFLYLLQIENR